MNRLLKFFGIVLLLGGLGHFVGVTHLYITAGIPEANRVLLDIWIGEAQLLGGCLYLAASRGSRAGKSSPGEIEAAEIGRARAFNLATTPFAI